MSKIRPALFVSLLLLVLAPFARADLRLDAIWSEGAVFAAGRPVVVRGTATPGAQLEVAASWTTPSSITVGADGRFRVDLAPAEPGGPYSLTVRGDGELEVGDLLAGVLWLASGQSNMDWPIGATGEDLLAFQPFEGDDELRYFRVDNVALPEPAADLSGRWEPCDDRAIDRFSAVAHAFARRLRAELGQPVGIVQTAWGGTPVAAWTRLEALQAIPGFGAEHATPEEGVTQHTDGALWNGMVAPLEGHRFDGVIWYQGEHDRLEYGRYGPWFRAMIGDWRRAFDDAALPFLFVQIAPFQYDGDLGELPRLREAQDSVLDLPATGRANTLDLGDPLDIHPRRKREVGERLAALALRDVYGRDVAVLEGPRVLRAVFRPLGARIDLAPDGDGLVAEGGVVRGFELAGEDRRFFAAPGEISGSSVHLECAEVERPVAARYAFGRGDSGNLRDTTGAPAEAWRSDDWPIGWGDAALAGEPLPLARWFAPFSSADTWREEGEVIACTGAPTSLLVSDRSYRDYELEFDWRHLEPGGNSGLFVAADPTPAPGSPFSRGIEVQIQDGASRELASTHGDLFGILGGTIVASNPREGSRRSFPTHLRQQPAPHWNQFRVRVNEGRIDLFANGVLVNSASSLDPAEGFLCLESEGSSIEFRRIRIREEALDQAGSPVADYPWARSVAFYRGGPLEPVFEPAGEGWTGNDWKLVGRGDRPLRTAERLDEWASTLSESEVPLRLELQLDFRRPEQGPPPVFLEGLEPLFEELFTGGFERPGEWNRLRLVFEAPGRSSALAEPTIVCRAYAAEELLLERVATWPADPERRRELTRDPSLSFWSADDGWRLGHLSFEAHGSELELANLVLVAPAW